MNEGEMWSLRAGAGRREAMSSLVIEFMIPLPRTPLGSVVIIAFSLKSFTSVMPFDS